MFHQFLRIFRHKKKKRSTILRHQGQHHNLEEIYHRLNTEYFENKLKLDITWFGNKSSVPKVKVRLGSYHERKKLIKIHRLLDQLHVPVYFVSSIVYHEMLHHVLPPVIGGRRRQIHHKEFLEKEKQFQEYLLAQAFMKELKKRWFFH